MKGKTFSFGNLALVLAVIAILCGMLAPTPALAPSRVRVPGASYAPIDDAYVRARFEWSAGDVAGEANPFELAFLGNETPRRDWSARLGRIPRELAGDSASSHGPRTDDATPDQTMLASYSGNDASAGPFSQGFSQGGGRGPYVFGMLPAALSALANGGSTGSSAGGIPDGVAVDPEAGKDQGSGPANGPVFPRDLTGALQSMPKGDAQGPPSSDPQNEFPGTPVPEPATLTLLGCGLAALALLLRHPTI